MSQNGAHLNEKASLAKREADEWEWPSRREVVKRAQVRMTCLADDDVIEDFNAEKFPGPHQVQVSVLTIDTFAEVQSIPSACASRASKPSEPSASRWSRQSPSRHVVAR